MQNVLPIVRHRSCLRYSMRLLPSHFMDYLAGLLEESQGGPDFRRESENMFLLYGQDNGGAVFYPQEVS